MTRLFVLGDIMGKAGRQAVEQLLPRIRSTYNPHIVLLNGENAAGGFGLTQKIYEQFVGPLGVDAVTMGNHWHDKREIYNFRQTAERLVLPANMANVEREDMGLRILTAQNGVRYAVINLIGRAFMHGENRCPFQAVEKLLPQIPAGVKIRIIDMHAEATSEKQALGWHLAGRVSMVYGTHSHVPTADERILEGKTGFVTDVGMTGAYDSVIGIRREAAIHRFLTGEKRKFEPAAENPWMMGIVADIDDDTGSCQRIERVRWSLNEILG